MDVDGKAVCQRLGSTGATGCNRCGFGYVQNGVLAVVLDPRNTQRSEYYADMSTNAGSERMKFEPPQGEQLFSVFVGTHVLDGSVSEIGPDGELQGQ
ncbi:MAG: hypothetical protein MUF54_25310 [Polyangiaceae bacterium]|nr:hypothetical protein [Polyangiaceae bacterium]